MNIHNELFNGVRQLRWQHLSPVVSTFSTSNRLSSSFFIKHCTLFLSLSVVSHPVVLITGLSLLFGDVAVFFLQSKVLRRKQPKQVRNQKLFAVRHIHYPVTISTLMQ